MKIHILFFLMIIISVIDVIVMFGDDVRPINRFGEQIFCRQQGPDQKCNAICQRKGYLLGFCDQKNCLCKVNHQND
uniref:U1-buthitoxin-Hj1a n=1 Tax=Hottentotta judaicus TaxID=6863 RepID=F1CIX4_HOTJU|nr:U1-buthitoxin-Hj1a [Hottentotta judaicus]